MHTYKFYNKYHPIIYQKKVFKNLIIIVIFSCDFHTDFQKKYGMFELEMIPKIHYCIAHNHL